MPLRKGKEVYAEKYEKALELHKNGLSIKEIAQKLGVSYSATYSWLKKGKKPEKSRLVKFKNHIKERGPIAAIELKNKFPKHNETYLQARKRGIDIKRKVLNRKYGEYRTWYYTPGQEKQLDEKETQLKVKYKKLMKEILDK